MRLIFLLIVHLPAAFPTSTFNIDQVNHELRRDILVAINHGGLNRVDNLQYDSQIDDHVGYAHFEDDILQKIRPSK